VKSKKAEITNYYIERYWSVSLKNIDRQNFVHNTSSDPIQSNPWMNPIHGHLWLHYNKIYTRKHVDDCRPNRSLDWFYNADDQICTIHEAAGRMRGSNGRLRVGCEMTSDGWHCCVYYSIGIYWVKMTNKRSQAVLRLITRN